MSIIPEHIKELILSAGGQVFLVGGMVRDQFLGSPSKDIDIVVCGVPYQDLKDILVTDGKIDEVGKSFGVIKWTPTDAKEPIDVALPRQEVSTGAGHQDFDVHFDHTLPIEEDLKRRDFTINAIAMDLDTDLFVDPFGGMGALKWKTLRTVTPDSFKDDPLRMMRGIQFMARFGFRLGSSTMKEMRKHSHCIKHISPERIAIELGKLFGKGKDLLPALYAMQDLGLWERIFTEIKCPTIEMGLIPKDLDLRFATIFSYGELRSSDRDRLEVAKEMIDELKLTSAGLDEKKVLTLVAHSQVRSVQTYEDGDIASPRLVRKFISSKLKGDTKLLFELAKLWSVDPELKQVGLRQKIGMITSICAVAARTDRALHPLTTRGLAIDGNDLQVLGLQGKGIGDMLKVALDLVLDDPSLNTKEDLIFHAKEYVSLHPAAS